MKSNLVQVYIVLIALLTSGCVVNTHTSKTAKPKAIERHYFNDWETDIGYAQAIVDGHTLYVSGVPAGGENMQEAMRRAYSRIVDILNKFGATTDDIVKEVLFTSDMDATKAAIEVRKSFFSDGQYPAATWVQVDRFFNQGLLLEVDVTVRLPN